MSSIEAEWQSAVQWISQRDPTSGLLRGHVRGRRWGWWNPPKLRLAVEEYDPTTGDEPDA